MGDVVDFGSKKRNEEVVSHLANCFNIEKLDKMIWEVVENKVEFETMKEMTLWDRIFNWPY